MIQELVVRSRVRSDCSHPWREKRRAAGLCRDCPRRLHRWKVYCDRCQASNRKRLRLRWRRLHHTRRSRFVIHATKPSVTPPRLPKRLPKSDPKFTGRNRVTRFLEKVTQQD